MKLYKYKSLNGDGLMHCLDAIVNKRLYLSTCKYMNDPNEGIWVFDEKNGPITIEHEELIRKLRQIVNDTRFTCFTAECAAPLLWAHYAGGFGGVAFEYNFDENVDIRKIEYNGTPRITVDDLDRLVSGELLPQDVGILRRKASCWSYEEEYRLYFKQVYMNISPSRIILGFNETLASSVIGPIAIKFQIPVDFLVPDPDGKYYALSSD